MVKKSTKSKSKRVPLRRKYKIIKKVKEHHRKEKRAAKKANGGGKRRKLKDPGVPREWPFRDEFLKEMAWERHRMIDEAKKKREERKRLRQVRCGPARFSDEPIVDHLAK